MAVKITDNFRNAHKEYEDAVAEVFLENPQLVRKVERTVASLLEAIASDNGGFEDC